MSEGSVSFASHRSGSQFNSRVRDPLFSRCVLWVPLDCDVRSGPTRNLVHYSIRRILLSNNALRAQKCGCYFRDATRLRGVDRPHHRSVHRRHRSQVEKTGDLVPDLTEVFAKLRQHRVKINPKKCVFGVPRGMLLGFVVSERGI
jgi:hypothetical protein